MLEKKGVPRVLWHSRKEQIAVPGRREVKMQEVGTEEGARAVTEPNMEIAITNIHFLLRIVRDLYRVVHFVVHVKRSS